MDTLLIKHKYGFLMTDQLKTKVYDVSYESALSPLGTLLQLFPIKIKGAAKAQVEAVRRLFPAMWTIKILLNQGVDALGWYHEKRDEEKHRIGA